MRQLRCAPTRSPLPGMRRKQRLIYPNGDVDVDRRTHADPCTHSPPFRCTPLTAVHTNYISTARAAQHAAKTRQTGGQTQTTPRIQTAIIINIREKVCVCTAHLHSANSALENGRACARYFRRWRRWWWRRIVRHRDARATHPAIVVAAAMTTTTSRRCHHHHNQRLSACRD